MCKIWADGKWHKADGIVSRRVDVVKSEIGQTLLKADKCKFIHFAGRKECFSKLNKEARLRTKYIVCNLKLRLEKDILVVTPNVLSFLEYWIKQNGIPHDRHYYEFRKKRLETMEKETAKEHVDKDIAEFDTTASGKILYQTYRKSLISEVFVMLLSTRTWDSVLRIGG